MKKTTFIDIFAGVGGFMCGMSVAGAKCVFSNEFDKYAAETYATWYGGKHLNTEDIKSLNVKDNIPRHDILCAGFPCQPFSKSGEQLGRSCPKDGDLFSLTVDILKSKKPRY